MWKMKMKFTSAELRLRRLVFRPPRLSSEPFWRRGRRLGRRRRRRRRRRLRCFWKEEEGVGQKFGCKKLACLRGGWLFFFKLFSYPLSFFSSSSFAGVVHPAVVVSTRRNLRPPRGGGGGGGGRVTRAEKELWKNIFLFRSTEIRWTFSTFN